MNTNTFWKKCSSCKKEISLGQDYYQCSVSTCKHPRKGFQFCSVPCWDAHLAYANHKESWAEEKKAPLKLDDNISKTVVKKPEVYREKQRTVVSDVIKRSASDSTVSSLSSSSHLEKLNSVKTDTLVVVSKVKQLVKDQSDFNTSQCFIDALTKKVVIEVLKAIDNAQASERKTVMGRDVR